MKTFIVTGSVATGKTTLAKALSNKLKYKYLDVKKIINKYKISKSFDKKRKTKIIDTKILNKYLIKEINNFKKLKINKNRGIIIDSHLSHFLPNKYVDLCIVTKCNLKTLEKRLKKRKYNKEKVRENLDSEIFDICFNESLENKHKVKVLDTTKRININHLIKHLDLE